MEMFTQSVQMDQTLFETNREQRRDGDGADHPRFQPGALARTRADALDADLVVLDAVDEARALSGYVGGDCRMEAGGQEE